MPRDAEPIGWPYLSIRPMPRVSDRNGLAASSPSICSRFARTRSNGVFSKILIIVRGFQGTGSYEFWTAMSKRPHTAPPQHSLAIGSQIAGLVRTGMERI